MERIVKGIWIPIEIWEANDLSWNEKILLMEIDSFTSQGKDCFISDEYIAEALKISVRSAATMVSNLIHKGYVKKTRFDGRKRYLESTLAEQLCKNCRADMQDLQTTYIESTYISPTEIINNKGNRFDFKKALMEIGVTEQVAEDWLKVRKEAKASNTETAFKGILREIEKTGLSADECIRVAAENSWRGFKAEWLFNQRKSNSGKPSVLENNLAVAEELMRR
jgi:DNA-binding MarR family transcriptional regulator